MIGGRNRHLDDLKVAVIGEAVREPRKKNTSYFPLQYAGCLIGIRDPCNGLI